MSYQPFSTTRPTGNGPFIHILDDYSLLNIFFFTRTAIFDESEVDNSQFSEDGEPDGEWNLERWWYRLVQVCRRWRYLVLESASHLRLSLVCTRGTPVADMLAHSPPLPLIINHFFNDNKITPEDEEGITLAFQHRDRVRRIRLRARAPMLQKLIDSLDGEFPILEYLFIECQRIPWSFDDNRSFSGTFRAPHLRHLLLKNFDIPIGSPLLTTGSIVTLSLNLVPRSTYFDPNALLQRLLLMPHLEILGISFKPHDPSGDVEGQLLRTPILTHVTLPNLRWLGFQGANAYLEAFLPQITTPLLEKLQLYFFNEPTYSIPHLRQFMSTARNLRLNTTTFTFREDHLSVKAYPHKGARVYSLSMSLGGRHLDHQVAQVFHTLSTIFSAAEHLTLESNRPSSEWINGANRTQWRELLGSFINVKTLFVVNELVGLLSRIVQPGEEESPLELLPELKELSYSAIGASHDAFTPFIDARQKAGCPVTLVSP